jgi:hypothetical protein
VFALLTFIIGINLRDSVLNATWLYTNTEAGIRAEYPQNWLIDTQGEYIFRVRDTSQLGYPTTIQVSTQPVGPDTPLRYIVDALSLNRAQILDSYSVLSSGRSITLHNESVGLIIDYTFAANENDPFLESIPIVVRGQDILAVKRGQVIIITFLSGSTTYDRNYQRFERFMDSLEF